jgi:small redox-active disulfide protein 2
MNIKILGTGCARCKILYSNTLKAVENLKKSGSITVEKIEDINKIMEYNVITMPVLVIDEKIIAKGKIFTVGEIEEILKKEK